MESGSINPITSQLIRAIQQSNLAKVQELVKKGENSFSKADLLKIGKETDAHYAKGYRDEAEDNWGEGKMALLIGTASFFAILGIIAYLVKDAKVPEILDQNVTIELDGTKTRNDFAVLMSSINHYSAYLFNVTKYYAKYAFGGTSASIATYTAIRFGCHVYFKNQYDKYNIMENFLKTNLPK